MKRIEMFDNMDFTSIPKNQRGIRCVFQNYRDQLRHQPDETIFTESYFDVYDLPLIETVPEFLECLEQNGITNFMITCRTTNTIDTLAAMQELGWVCDGIGTVPRTYCGEYENINGIYVHKI